MTIVKRHMTLNQIETIAFMLANHVDSLQMNEEVRSHLPQLDTAGIADAVMGAVYNEIVRQLKKVSNKGQEIELVNFYIESLFEELSLSSGQSTHSGENHE